MNVLDMTRRRTPAVRASAGLSSLIKTPFFAPACHSGRPASCRSWHLLCPCKVEPPDVVLSQFPIMAYIVSWTRSLDTWLGLTSLLILDSVLLMRWPIAVAFLCALSWLENNFDTSVHMNLLVSAIPARSRRSPAPDGPAFDWCPLCLRHGGCWPRAIS